MPAEIFITRGTVLEGTDAVFVGRLSTSDGTQILQADISDSDLEYSVFYLSGGTPSTAVATGTSAVATSVFDTLKTDGYWGGLDETGYNFRVTIPTADFTQGAGRYKVEVTTTTSSFGEAKAHAIVDVVESFDTT